MIYFPYFYKANLQKMKKKGSSFLRTFLVLIIMTVYFTIAVSHIFFLPCLSHLKHQYISSHNSISKRKINNFLIRESKINLLERQDKSTLENKKSILELLNGMIFLFILLLAGLQLWKLMFPKHFNYHPPVLATLPNYLNFCTFRL